jgi:ATP-binding cassette subfamily A (ABC1) protein 3
VQAQQKLGYCPQFDGIVDQMTVTETLTMYARLRGIREADISRVVEVTIKNLLLQQHANRQAQLLSGGNKRKLCTAIALVGDPPIICLDEPTTGMDPGARRYLWKVLTGLREKGRTIILTSHRCAALIYIYVVVFFRLNNIALIFFRLLLYLLIFIIVII